MAETVEPKRKTRRWISMAVDVFDHPLLACDPFDRRSAWLWLVAKAAFEPHTTRVGGIAIPLQRGQVLVGRDYLAKCWQWTSTKRVRTFLRDLERAGQLKLAGQHGNGRSRGRITNVATICNYDKFQFLSTSEGHFGAGSGPVEGQTSHLTFKGSGSSPQSSDDPKNRPAVLHRYVSEDALNQVRAIAPGWDRQALLKKFTDWPGSKDAQHIDRAFLGWVKSFTKGKAAA